jgi:hypothetical protein
LSFILRHDQDRSDGLGKIYDYNGPNFLVRLGEQWPHDPRFRLIHATTRDPASAKQFDTEGDALACWSEAGKPSGWTVVQQ